MKTLRIHFGNLSIGARLSLGFGAVLALLLALTGLSHYELTRIGGINRMITQETWAKANAISVVDVTTRANARANLELIVNPDPAATQRLFQQIEANRKRIDEALATMRPLMKTADAAARLRALEEARGRYVKSFQSVGAVLKSGDREGARQRLLQETLPILDSLQDHIIALSRQQAAEMDEAGTASQAVIDEAERLNAGLSALALAVGALLAWRVSRSITRPLARAVKAAEAVASGDLGQRIEAGSRDETGRLLHALQDMQDRLAGAVRAIRQGSETISSASGQIAAGNTDLSSRTEEQAASLEETAASMEELASTVKQTADNARQANQLAASASEIALRGGAAVSAVVGTMQDISASSHKISDIVSVIDGIAFQTNILALNAAVEAARAGEQGKGFAVVAGEVRSLAQRSAQAAREVKALIEDSAGKVGAGARQAEGAGATMQEIVTAVQRVTDIMGEIAAASHEQASGIDQVNRAVAQMDEVTQQNAALVEEAAAAAGSMQDQARELVRAVGVFRLAEDGARRGQDPAPAQARGALMLA
ncbi:methyl-accepting chemotaxis protein [Achromobacter sp. SLBN-14]|uniref:methyl-accepting chemotaxis protein n=1 Tax=Achromobacter sp. SLBN-14 TaxID=2768442 RepID=UPI001152D66A|nr:methyl-accepting chemotaxis protein [Achromobacter sp. SLBN-14]TQJ97565.1 methyl-accepting chemotaxis protein [Achromobacter sp. SLBN-14]